MKTFLDLLPKGFVKFKIENIEIRTLPRGDRHEGFINFIFCNFPC